MSHWNDRNSVCVSSLVARCALLLLSTGCTHHYVPKQGAIEEGRVPPFTATHAVEVTNAQTSAEPILAGQQGAAKWMADLRAWTDVAIGVMRTELASHGRATPHPA